MGGAVSLSSSHRVTQSFEVACVRGAGERAAAWDAEGFKGVEGRRGGGKKDLIKSEKMIGRAEQIKLEENILDEGHGLEGN